jgi:hypothetical protein
MSYYDKLLTVYGLDYIDKINKSSVLIYGSNDYLTNDIIKNFWNKGRGLFKPL